MTVIAHPSLVRPLLSCAAALALVACAVTPHPDAAPDARLSTEQFPITVEDQPREMLLATHAQGLSPNQRSALSELAADWRDAGRGPIRIQAPGNPAGQRVAEAARLALISDGAPDAAVLLTGYEAAAADAPVRVAFVKRAAAIPACDRQWENLTSTAENRVQPNFGCSISANMAAQIADPSDLLASRPMDPADAGRRQVVLDKYRKGEITGAAKPDSDGYVSNAIK